MEEGLHNLLEDDDYEDMERTVCLSDAEVQRRYEAAVQRLRSGTPDR
jgi:hypothetical protein